MSPQDNPKRGRLSQSLAEILIAINAVHEEVSNLRSDMKTLELKHGFLQSMVSSHDTKIERLIVDVDKIDKRVTWIFDRKPNKNEEPRTKWGERWYITVESIAEFLHTLPTFWHLIATGFLFLASLATVFKDHIMRHIK